MNDNPLSIHDILYVVCGSFQVLHDSRDAGNKSPQANYLSLRYP